MNLLRLVPLLSLALFASCVEQTTTRAQAVDVIPDSANAVILVGGTVVTMSQAGVIPDGGIVIKDGRVAFVGTAEEALSKAPEARRTDLSGLTVLPGLTDAHAHISSLGASLDSVDLTGTISFDEVVERIVERAEDRPEGEWITGRGWDQNDWPTRTFPQASDLDPSVTSHPVAVTRIDGHALFANSLAMEIAGVSASTPDPAGGKIHRDAKGNPTGVFVDNAMALIGRAIPGPTREQQRTRLMRATEFIASQGLTEVHDVGVDQVTIDLMKELADEGRLRIRVYVMLEDDGELLDQWFERGPLIDYAGRITVRSVKLYADGALGSRGAALLDDYSDDPGNRGLLVSTPDHILKRARQARAAGFQVGVHAIGDRGNRIVLDAFEKVGVVPDERCRIEHLQIISLDDIPRLSAMGVIASMQPTHATSDGPWVQERIGNERMAGAYAWRKVLDSGAKLALGSDFPVEYVSPLNGLFAAVNRTDRNGHPDGGWQPEEKLTVEEALAGFTRDAAWAAFEEASRGTIEAGKLADFTILDNNPLDIDPSELDDLGVVITMVDGKVVFESF